MKDILLGEDGDLYLDNNGDIAITDSVKQAINIRLKWFLGEWVFAPDKGTPYFESILVKNPDTTFIEALIAEQIMLVDEVKDVVFVNIEIDAKSRKANVDYEVITDSGTYREEVDIWRSME